MAKASVRAGWTQHILRSARALPAERRGQIEAAIAASTLATVDAAGSLAWLPLSEHMGVLRGMRSVLGAQQYRSVCRKAVRDSLEHPLLFAKQAAYALEVVHASAWTIYKVVPVGLRQIFRDMGTVTVVISPDESQAKLTYQGFPPEYSADDVWSLIWLGTLDALAAHTFGRRGERVEVVQTRQVPGEGCFEWQVRL